MLAQPSGGISTPLFIELLYAAAGLLPWILLAVAIVALARCRRSRSSRDDQPGVGDG